jgi:hypothetical protein
MKLFFLVIALLTVRAVSAQPDASTPYMPSWQARHYLALLVDHAGLQLTLTHWPLPWRSVEQALLDLPETLPVSEVGLQEARLAVLREIRRHQQFANVTLQLRGRAEGLIGFGENYTPGSSVQAASGEIRWVGGSMSLAGRLGARFERTSNSLSTAPSGIGTGKLYQLRPEGTSAILNWNGWNLQSFSQRQWWGPGWQSSLINGSNNLAWDGVGLQRSNVAASSSPWLAWLGPWNLDIFTAQARDPRVIDNQPKGFLYSGMRLTMRPRQWLEIGLSRSLQFGGQGRPSGAKDFAYAFFGQKVNQDPGDPPDGSNQIAGYDARVRCPKNWGQCAFYTQWMGEDAAGRVPLPYKFMSLWGLENTVGNGQFRIFAEYTDTNAPSLPWETGPRFAGLTNGVYSQGYTNGGRWVGSSQGGGSQLFTLGWMDIQRQYVSKLFVGNVGLSLGAFSPGANAPHGHLYGLSLRRGISLQGLDLVPEFSWTHLINGDDLGVNKRNNMRVGVTALVPISF